MVGLVVACVVFVLWVLASARTSRPDGTLLRVHPYRRLMAYIMPQRNESVVYFDCEVRAEALLAYLDRAREAFRADVTHAVVAACNIGLAEVPEMNRFVVGRRMYQRTGRWVTFSMKRKKLDRAAKLSAVKLQMRDGETFAELCSRIDGQIGAERSGEKTHADKEFAFFNVLPRPLLRAGHSLLRLVDYYNLLPASFIDPDGMYTSMFVANLGSLGMGPGYHHLYEWGTCPLFMMVGRIEDRPVIEDGRVVAGKVIHIRYTYDERTDDGLNARHGIDAVARVLADPARYLGCIAADHSDTRPMWPRTEADPQAVIPAS